MGEYCPVEEEGTLFDAMYESTRMPEDEATQYVRQIVYGLGELYRQNIYL